MRVLVVSPQIPYPLVDGGKRAIYYPLKYLSERGHTLHIACLTEFEERRNAEAIRHLGESTVVVNSKRRTPGSFLASLGQSTPYLLSRFHNPELLTKVLHVSGKYDVVQIEGLHCAFFGLELMKHSRTPVVLRLHNVESGILERFAAQSRNPLLKWYVRAESRKVKRYEKAVLPSFDKVMMISKVDENSILSIESGIRTAVLPAGVDTEYFQPATDNPAPDSILWMASFQWPPNRDSFWWFMKSVLPLIVDQKPSVLVTVVGSHPPAEVLSFRHPNVRVVGHVEDVRASIGQASVCVVPLRIGGGIRLKLLELFAMKKAVVSTTIGCEGLAVKTNEHLLVADSEADFAEATVQLLGDAALRRRLGESGRSFVLADHSWDAIAQRYELIYEEVVRSRQGNPRKRQGRK